MRRRELPFLLVLTAVFLIGVIGHILLRTPKEEAMETEITLAVEGVSAFLSPSLPHAGDRVTLLSEQGVLTAVRCCERLLVGRESGATVARPSTLTRNLTLTLRLPAHVREGRLYVGDRMLLMGDSIPLSGENYGFSARLTAFTPLFERKMR